MEKNDYDKKRYTQMKILKQDMEIMKKEIEQLKDALKKKVETETKIEQKVELIETSKVETIEIPTPMKMENPEVETLETPNRPMKMENSKMENSKVERHLQYEIPVKIDEMESVKSSRVIQYIDSYPPTKFTRHQTHRNSRTMKMLK